ncbi:asparaginase [Gracilibacillus sp. YIM 98692]|uniref:asparaginase n=1 Tax=Gracilibacillus sp. YIM 98692 TaxID=2663532 RepID=UPI0013D442E0|nr:asparaginase [Gracilibacillus sp. YIM 98692]
MKKILIVHTGGTISMEEDPSGHVVETKKHPLSHVESHISCQIEQENLFHIPSPHMTPSHMLELSQFIKRKIASEQYTGIVITHGTDTLEETAYFVDLCVNTATPIIFTGAMRSSNEIGADGLYNLICSVCVATHHSAPNRGVLVVMNDEIHTAQYVTKTSTSSVATFQSPQFGPIGIVTKKDVIFYATLPQTECYSIDSLEKEVILLKTFSGMPSFLLDNVQTNSVDGVVIEGFGQGNVPPSIVPSIESLIYQGVPIVLVSRSYQGMVQPNYDYQGGGKSLEQLGVIFANQINGPKARLKLQVLLENEYTNQQLKEVLSAY